MPMFDPNAADETGLVGVGADLEPRTIIEAYASGVFPTRFAPFDDERLPMFWWSPDPRAVIELNGLHVSRRLARTIRSNKFFVTFDHDFDGVIRGCADRAQKAPGSQRTLSKHIRGSIGLASSTVSKYGTATAWPVGRTALRSVACSPPNPCFTVSAMLRKSQWRHSSIG